MKKKSGEWLHNSRELVDAVYRDAAVYSVLAGRCDLFSMISTSVSYT